MTEAKTITENEWTLLNDSSKNLTVFFDDDGDGAIGQAFFNMSAQGHVVE